MEEQSCGALSVCVSVSVFPPPTCYVLHAGDGHGAVLVDAVAAPGQLAAVLLAATGGAFVHVHEIGSPLIGHGRRSLHALVLSAAMTPMMCGVAWGW